ncbi:hypothetical protein PDN31_15300 [Bacillus cereus]|nr:hypothetical protein [Bacillus cereus]MDA2133715.1 hypothetical protein [Bacillus cereus]
MTTLRIIDVTTGEDRTQEYNLIGKEMLSNLCINVKIRHLTFRWR